MLKLFISDVYGLVRKLDTSTVFSFVSLFIAHKGSLLLESAGSVFCPLILA